MKTIIPLEFAFNILNLKEYLKECHYEDKIELEECVVEYFRNELGIPITYCENFKEIMKKLIDIIQ